MKSGARATLMILSIVCIFVLIATAQTKPNFSGEWKMNPQKSKFADGGPDAITIKIDHKEPALTEDWSMSTPDGERSFQAKYTTDGAETEQNVMGRTAKTSAKWAGDSLVIEFKSANGFFNRKLTLSTDGKTLTKVVTHGEGNDAGSREDTVVFEKQ